MLSQCSQVKRSRNVKRRKRRSIEALFTVLGALVLCSGCSISRLATESMADVLAEDSVAYAADEDIDLIGDATPFALKTIESVLVRVPEHRGLLTAAARGFTQYAYVYVQLPAEELERRDVAAAYQQRARAKSLYLRARDYGLRGLGYGEAQDLKRLRTRPSQEVGNMDAEDIELLYWTGVAWAAAISLGKDEPHLIADLPVVDAIISRAAALDPEFDDGGLHTFLVGYEMGRPGAGADAAERARRHFRAAVELSEGNQAAPYVALAESVAVPQQRRQEYQQLLNQALAVDTNARPEWRLANLVMQRRARRLLDRIDEFFVE